MNVLKLDCQPIDDLLGGGIERGIITKFYGETGTGKTNLCLQLSRECIITGKKVVFIDPKGVSIERLNQIFNNKYDNKKILDNILFFKPSTLENQEKIISDSMKIKDIGLIIVDSINMLYRINLEKNRDKTMRSFTRQITNLQIFASEMNLYVVLTEQVYTDKKGKIKPFTNRDTEHMIKTIIKLEKTFSDKREATIIKHRTQTKGKKAFFKITEKGLE